MPGRAWINWSTVATAVLVAALATGCGATSVVEDSGVHVSEACGADRREDPHPKAPDAHLVGDEIERAKAQGKGFGEDPDLYVMIVETIMQDDGISAADAMAQAAIQYRADAVNEGAIKRAADGSFGGIWFDPDHGGKYTVAVTEGAAIPAVEAVLRKHGLLKDSAVVTVRSTYADLERAQAEVDPIVFGDPAGRELGIDVSGNCVIATVAKGFADEQVDAIQAVGEELGVAVRVDRIDETAGPPQETGVITEIDGKGSVLEKPADEGCGIWVSASEETEVVRESGEPASWSDLAVGDTIGVWFAGAIAASCPGLAGAAKVVILD